MKFSVTTKDVLEAIGKFNEDFKFPTKQDIGDYLKIKLNLKGDPDIKEIAAHCTRLQLYDRIVFDFKRRGYRVI